MAMKGWSVYPKAPALLGLTIRQFSVITGHSLGRVLRICRGAVSIFYSPSRLVKFKQEFLYAIMDLCFLIRYFLDFCSKRVHLYVLFGAFWSSSNHLFNVIDPFSLSVILCYFCCHILIFICTPHQTGVNERSFFFIGGVKLMSRSIMSQDSCPARLCW